MTAPAISVVVPTHNRRDAVMRLLTSLAIHGLARDGFEVVLVCDGCTDDTVAGASREAWPFSLEIIEQAASGAAASRNAGARRAAGEVLLFLDDDVEVESGALDAHAALHATNVAAIGLGYLPAVVSGTGMFAKTLRGWWEAMFDEPRRVGCRYGYRNLLTGHFSIRRDRFLESGGFDERLACHEDYEFGYRAIHRGLTLRFLPSAVARHYDATTIGRAHERKRAEGIADVHLTRLHPELTASLPLWRPQEGGRFRRLLISLAWHAPAAGDAIVRVQLALLPLYESFGLRFRWRARLEATLSYCYFRGVAQAAKQESVTLAALHARAPRVDPPAVTLDLADGITTIHEKVDRLRPRSARIVYGNRFVGTIPDIPGTEALRGHHVAPFVARFLREEFLTVAGAAQAMPPIIARSMSTRDSSVASARELASATV